MSEPKLTNCHFCGGKVYLIDQMSDSGSWSGFTVEHEEQGCGITLDLCSTEEEALEQWNRYHGMKIEYGFIKGVTFKATEK